MSPFSLTRVSTRLVKSLAVCGALFTVACLSMTGRHGAGRCHEPMVAVKPTLTRLANIPSHNRVYRASLLPTAGAVLLHRDLRWPVEVRTAAGQFVEGAALDVECWMPDEPTVPTVRPRAVAVTGGGYRIEGLRFDRRGWWNVRLRINSPAGTDSLAFNIVL